MHWSIEEIIPNSTWGNQQKHHRHKKFEFDTINDKEDTPLERTARTNAQWHQSQWYSQENTLSWDGGSAGYMGEGRPCQGHQQGKEKKKMKWKK